MNHFKITTLVFLLGMAPLKSHAIFGTADAAFNITYPCLGLDGIPINGSLAGQCCDGSGNLRSTSNDQCRTSLYGAGTAEATSGTGASLNLAQETLDSASDLNGSTSSFAASEVKSDVGNGSTSGVASALTSSGSGSAADGTGSYSSTGNGTGTDGMNGAGSGSGSGSGGSGSGSGAGGSGVGTTGGTSSHVAGANDANGGGAGAGGKSEDGAGRYSASTGSGSGDGNGGKIGGLFGSLFGGNAGGKNGADGMGDAKFGDDGSNGADGSNADKDGLTGTSKDPADYFNRIDKSASIFKIVSTRYTKETERGRIGIASITK